MLLQCGVFERPHFNVSEGEWFVTYLISTQVHSPYLSSSPEPHFPNLNQQLEKSNVIK